MESHPLIMQADESELRDPSPASMSGVSVNNPQSTDSPQKVADAPFDVLNPDTVILRSCDSVDFHVFKCILSLSSAFFKDMFSLHQPVSSSMDDRVDSIPIIDVPETSIVLNRLLRLCYPISDPIITALGDIGEGLAAAIKYDMEHPIAVLSRLLRRMRKTQPLQVYAVACCFKLEDVARDAAIRWRETAQSWRSADSLRPWNQTPPGESYVEDMADVSAGAFYRLVCYVRTGEMTSFCEPSPGTEVRSSIDVQPILTIPPFDREAYPPDIIIKSFDAVDLPAHRMILSLTSPVLKKMISEALVEGGSNDNLPVLNFQEDSEVVAVLLRFCYPPSSNHTPNLSDAGFALCKDIISAAIKYEVTGAIGAGKERVMEHLLTDPMRVYFAAICFGWEAEAYEAALHLTRLPVEDLYTPEMERILAKFYYPLLKFQYDYRRAINGVAPEACNIWTTANWLWEDAGYEPLDLLIATLAKNYGYDRYSYGSSSAQARLAGAKETKENMKLALSQVNLEIPWECHPLYFPNSPVTRVQDSQKGYPLGKRAKRKRKGKKL